MAKKREKKKKRETGREKKGNNNFPLSTFLQVWELKRELWNCSKGAAPRNFYLFSTKISGLDFFRDRLCCYQGIEMQHSTPVVQ